MRRVRIKCIRDSNPDVRASFGPMPRLEIVAHPDAVHLGVLPHRPEAHLSPDAAHLHPADGEAGSTSLYELIHTIPARSFAASPWARRRFCVQSPAPRPYGTPFAIATASSSLAKGVTVMNGPNTSSWQIRMLGSSACTSVGST